MSELTSKDLMVGDWVDAFDEEHHLSKIVELKKNSVVVFDDYEEREVELDYNSIEPIPITLDIMVRNSFKELAHGYYILDIGCMRMIYDSNKNSINIDTPAEIYEGLVHNIHELQHIFAVCRIEREIKL